MPGSASQPSGPAPERRRLPSPHACGETSALGTPRRSFVPTFIMMTPRQRLGIGAASLAFDELPFDVVLGNEFFNRVAKNFGHWHRFDEIGAGFREGLPLRGIGGHGRHRVGPGALRRAHHDPDVRGAGREVLTITRRLGAIEIDRSAAGIIKGRLLLLAQNRPWLHLRLIGQDADAAPDEIDPGRVRLAAFDHDADGNAQQGDGGGTQLAASRCLIGNPVNRFCGFIRRFRSGVMAMIRYTGSCSTISATNPASVTLRRNSASTRPAVRSSRASPCQSRSPTLVASESSPTYQVSFASRNSVSGSMLTLIPSR